MNKLSLFEDTNLPAPRVSSDQISKIIDSKSFLPRIQLMTAGTDKCKSGDFPINHFALIKGKDFIDCGKQIDVAVLEVRLKAVDTSVSPAIITVNPEMDSDGNPIGEFKRIMDKSGEQDSGCLFGPEFLVYFPEKKTYAGFFMGSVSARIESPNLQGLMHQCATLMSQKLENTAHTWYAPKAEPCQTELIVPEKAEVFEEIKKFMDEKSKTVGEVASKEEQESTERSR